MSANKEVSVMVMDGTSLVSEAAQRHKTSATSSAALGRTIVGATLLGAFQKQDRVVQVTFKGNGPAGIVQATANSDGLARGRVQNPFADLPLNDKGKLNVRGIVGQGVLSVVRSHPLEPQPYTGIVPIVSGEIAEDLAHYLAESEQTNSALALGVKINKDLSINSAGGYLVQVLPFVTEETLQILESNITNLPNVSDLLGQGMNAMDITDKLLEGLGKEETEETAINPTYGPCEQGQLKKRMKRALVALGRDEVEQILEKQGRVEMKDEFCQITIEFGRDEVMELLRQSEES